MENKNNFLGSEKNIAAFSANDSLLSDLKDDDNYINIPLVLRRLKIILFIIPVLVLLGWQFDVAVFKTVYPGYVAMNPLSALLFIAAGGALLFIGNKQSVRNLYVVRFIGGFISVIAVIKLLDLIWGFDFGIDQIIFRDKLMGNRMAPNTALNFFLIGLSLLSMNSLNRRNYIVAQIIALVALLIAFFAVIGYVYGAVNLYRLTIFIPMAVHAAFSFVLLTTAILLSGYKHGFIRVFCSTNVGGSVLRRILPVCILVPFAVVWLRIKAVSLHLVSMELGSALTVVIIIGVFSMLMWRLATFLNRSDAQKKSADTRLQSILDNSPSMIYVKDLTGKYQLVNRKFKEFFEVQDMQIIGKTDYDLGDVEKAEFFRKSDQLVIETGKPIEVEETLEHAGIPCNLLITKFPLLDGENNVYGVSGIASNITERIKYQEQLITAKKGAENAKNLQENFLANMSHEIRTPMNGIQGMTDLLLETSLDKEQQEFTSTIKRAADNLMVIINDILDVSKIQAGKLIIEHINFRPAEIISGVEKIFRHKLAKSGLRFQCNVAGDVPDVLCGDPYRLNQILVNLIGNAIKFTPEGEISVNVTAAKSDNKGITIHIEVTDTGIGIKEDEVADIFKSFSQAGPHITRKYGGSGLGLSICRQLLHLQGGDISVVSSPGKGSSFRFHIYYGLRDTCAPIVEIEKSLVSKEILRGVRFLIAEDNPVNQKVILKLIQRSGGLAEVVNNGAEAIAKLNAGNDYDIIIMDLQMPEMDGYTATNIIRNEMELKIPIIAMTATAMKGEKIKCIKAGMNEYLSKPFVFDHFYQSVYNVVTQASNSIGPTNKNIRETGSPAFSLALLDEMEDEEYTIDILETFIKQTPAELDELYNAAVEKDYIKVTAVAHKLKGSTGLLQIFAVTALLESIERDDHSLNTTLPEMVNKVIKIYADIEKQLVRKLNLMTKKPQNV